jgi:hypothetical protein
MASIVWDSEGILLAEFLERGATINSEKLKQRIQRVRTNRKVIQFLLLYDNKTAHQSGLKGGNCNNGVDCSPSSSLQSQFGTARLPSFGPLKDALRGRRFADDNELKHYVHEGLRRFSRELYSTSIQRLTERWKKCVVNEGDFVEK